MLEDQVVVAVVVKNAAGGEMGAGGDHQIGRREAVMADRGEFVLSIQGDSFDRVVYGKPR